MTKIPSLKVENGGIYKETTLFIVVTVVFPESSLDLTFPLKLANLF